ncbi:hypothetical protein D3C72_2289320 [compost metagenome]
MEAMEPQPADVIDRQVGRLPWRERADTRQPQHLRTACGTPVDDFLHAGLRGPAQRPVHQPREIGLMHHAARFIGRHSIHAQ